MEAFPTKMPRYSWSVLLAKLLLEGGTPVLGQNTSTDIFQYIDPLIGTTNGGHVFPGATLPFGMAKSVPDVNSDERQGGYASDDGESEKLPCPEFITNKLTQPQSLASHICTTAAQVE